MPPILSKPDNPNKNWTNDNLYGFLKPNITVVALKTFAKEVGLTVSGNKAELIARCAAYQTKHRFARVIQKTFRGYYTRLWIKLKQGTGQPPVNDTDFYTLEPICEMSFLSYLHYTEPDTNLSYVFNILSIHEIIHKMPRFENPYTRANMEHYNPILIHICRLTALMYKPSKTNTEFKQELTILEKARSLFIEIDLLGHYTNLSWFLDLDDRDLHNFHNNLLILWTSLSDATRITINPSDNLFDNIDRKLPIQEIMLILGNRMVFPFDGDRSLGTFYYLMALTTVSPDARSQYAFLYDTYTALVNAN